MRGKSGKGGGRGSAWYDSAGYGWDDDDDDPMGVYALPSQQRHKPARHTGVWLLIAFLLLVVSGAAGGTYWLLGSGRLAWVPGLGADTLQDVRLTDVTASNGTLVAVGEGPADLGTRPVFLFSTDQGQTWRHARVRGSTGKGTSVYVKKVVATGGQWLALGVTQTGPPVLWTSRDGQAWSRAPTKHSADDEFSENDHISQVAWTGSGYVMAGTRRQDGDYLPIVWTPTGDRSWQRHEGADLGFAKGGTSAMPLSLAAHGKVAVTEVSLRQGEKYQGSSYWRSTDGGRTWEKLGPSPKAGGTYFPASDIVSDPKRGLVAFGSQGASVQLFRWKDSKSWSPLGTLPRFPGSGEPALPVVRHLSASDSGYVALIKEGRKDRLAFFSSANGRDWTSGGDDSVFELQGKLTLASAIAATEQTVVTTVNRDTGDGGGAQIYVAPKGGKPEPADLPENPRT